MPTENLKSTIITNAEASTANDKRISGGILKESVATFEFAVADVGSTYRICRLPARARLARIILKCDAAIDSACAIHIGLYQTTENGGAVVDADCYATAIDLAGAGLISTVEANQKYQVLDISKIQQFVWQNGSVATEPIRGWEYDLVAVTSTALNTTGGTVNFTVQYVDGN